MDILPMFMRSLLISCLMLVILPAQSAENKIKQGPGLGTRVSESDIAGWDTSIFPDGTGLPDGKGTVSDGEKLYNQYCIACHGPHGRGASADELSGGRLPLTLDPPDKTIGTYWPYATTLFDYILRAMPMNAPRSLKADDVYALSAYLLYVNEVIEKDAEMNSTSLLEVKMPNRDGFDSYWPDKP